VRAVFAEAARIAANSVASRRRPLRSVDLEHSDTELKQPLCDVVALHSLFPVL
jgi:hypothetical protein